MVRLHDYEQFVGAETVGRIRDKALRLKDRRVLHMSSTYYGGGVAQYLSTLSLLMNDLGIRAEWRIIQGNPDFFNVTKQMHNALQGGEMELTEHKKQIYEQVNADNAFRNLLVHEIVVMHDPQVLPMITCYPKTVPWIWRCHIDMSQPNQELWAYLKTFVDRFDAMIVSTPEYAQTVNPPQFVFMPATDPLSMLNQDVREDQADGILARYQIPTDLPLVVQISRFDKWKDPLGVIEAFKKACKKVDARLILLGSAATDDPEGEQVFRSLQDQRSDKILIMNVEDSLLVNSLQRRAAAVLQKSLREGFGLTVTEAMWKSQPVIGGNVGGIRYQIDDEVNGFLVDDVDQAADRIVKLVKQPELRREMGVKAKEKVREKFLMTRLLEQYLDLFNALEVEVHVKISPALARVTPNRVLRQQAAAAAGGSA